MFMVMWAAMMVAMMLPSSLPAILRYRRNCRAETEVKIAICTTVMGISYLLVWAMVGAIVFAAGVVWAEATMHWERLSRAMPLAFAVAICVAGIMQFMPWTTWGLRGCRGMACREESVSGAQVRSAVGVGLRCGLSCVACCAGPTIALLALGMMNPVVMALLAALIAFEKLAARPQLLVRASGVIASAAGLVMAGRFL
jgi:predicted metal-binding membrane protein